LAARSLRSLVAGLRPRPRPGEAGEDLACRFLQRLGFTILARNFRCRAGELDIVAREGVETVFVEVKERSSRSHGAGHEAVTRTKRRRIVRAAVLYAASRGLTESPLRFDVISIEHSAAEGRPTIRHDRGAFDSEGG
jgi:putative endonuclease